MYISMLKVENFRNYKLLSIELDSNNNLLYGENGSGKTNIIEAIYYVATGKSFRCNSDQYMVKYDNYFFNIELYHQNIDNIGKKYSVEYNKLINKKVIKENEKYIKKLSDIIGKIPIILFSPEHLYIIKGEPQLRRKFIDNILIMTDKEYYDIYVKYNRIIIQRNHILKSIKDGKIDKKNIEIWNQQLKVYSEKIVKKRIEVIEKINKIINNNFLKNSIEISLKYKLKNNIEANENDLNEYYEYFFKKYFNEEIYRTITLIGPHRDDIEVLLNKKLLKYYGSEGQQRMSCILMKLAEGIYIKEKKDVYPIVLLDDFTSELDEKNKYFISEIFNIFKQIIITTTNKENVRNIKINRCFYVANGEIRVL